MNEKIQKINDKVNIEIEKIKNIKFDVNMNYDINDNLSKYIKFLKINRSDEYEVVKLLIFKYLLAFTFKLYTRNKDKDYDFIPGYIKNLLLITGRKCIICEKSEISCGYPFIKRPLFCGKCKLKNMCRVKTKPKKCKCGKLPSFGYIEKKPVCCIDCKSKDMVD